MPAEATCWINDNGGLDSAKEAVAEAKDAVAAAATPDAKAAAEASLAAAQALVAEVMFLRVRVRRWQQIQEQQ
jgi:hypothetical protein